MTDDVQREGILRFVELAEAYCAFVEEANGLPMDERLRKAAVMLAELYAHGLRLPDLEIQDDSEETPALASTSAMTFADHDIYWEVFDPYEETDPVAGSLSDDVLDVYLDVRRGLAIYGDGTNNEAVASAVWEWRFHLGVHWGDHAVDALRALQRAIHRCEEAG